MLAPLSWHRLATSLTLVSVAIYSAATPDMPAGAAGPPTAASDAVDAETVTYMVLLLRDPATRSELKLSPQQASSFDALIAKVEYPLFLLRDLPAKERDPKLKPIQDALHQELTAVLNVSQRSRLGQLIFQARGTAAITSADTIARLALSEIQIKRIAKVRLAAKSEIETASTIDAAATGKDKRLAHSKRSNQEYEAIIAVLNDRQRAMLSGLIGDGFDFSNLKWVATTAPEFRNVETWINSEPVKLRELRGKVVIVHFWAFDCINCIRNLPHYQQWHDKFSADEVTVIGVQTPETERERTRRQPAKTSRQPWHQISSCARRKCGQLARLG